MTEQVENSNNLDPQAITNEVYQLLIDKFEKDAFGTPQVDSDFIVEVLKRLTATHFVHLWHSMGATDTPNEAKALVAVMEIDSFIHELNQFLKVGPFQKLGVDLVALTKQAYGDALRE